MKLIQLRRNFLFFFLILICGILIGINIINVYFGVSNLDFKVTDLVTVIFSAVLVYYSTIQAESMKLQEKILIELNQPLFEIIHDSLSQWKIINHGRTPAWRVNIDVKNVELDRTIKIGTIPVIYPASSYFHTIPSEWIMKEYTVQFKIEYFLEKYGDTIDSQYLQCKMIPIEIWQMRS